MAGAGTGGSSARRTVRCLRIATAGEDFLLATTLADRERFPRSALGEAYHGRWGIEELYKVSKHLVRVGQFHARTECGVRQELFAHFTVVALTRFLGNRAEDALGGCLRDGSDVQVNFKHALASVARRFEALILGQVQAVAETVSGLLRDLGECIGKARPGRSYPRVSHRPDERFRNANRKSGSSRSARTVAG